MTFSNPASGASSHAAKYVAALMELLGDSDPLVVQEQLVPDLRDLLRGVSSKHLGMPEAPHKWCMLDVVRHLAHTELVYAYRYRVTIAHDRPNIPGFDQDLWSERLVIDGDDVGRLIDRLDVLRGWNLDFLKSVPDRDYVREGQHEERGWESLAQQIRLGAAHDLVHKRQLKRIRSAIA